MATSNVKLKSGEVVPMTYPDDWSTEQVEQAIHKQFPDESSNESEIPETPFNGRPIPSEEPTGLKAVGADALRSLGDALKSGVGFGRRITDNLKKSGKYIEEHPGSSILHNAGQLAAGTADLGKSLLNTPHDLLKYFLKKHLAIDIPIPGTKINTSDLIPHIPEDTGIENALGLAPDKSKGDELIRAVPEIAALGSGVTSLVKATSRLVTAPSKGKLFQRALEEKIAKAGEKVNMSEADLKDLQNALKLDYSNIFGETLGEASSIPLREKINVGEHKLAEKKPFTEIPEKDIGEIPAEPDTKAIIEQKKAALEKAKADAESTLGTLDNPRLKAGAKVKKAIEEVHDTSDALYKSARTHYVDQKIQANNGAEIKAVTKDLEALKDADELAPGYGSGTPEQKALETQIDSLKGEKVNASDIFDLQRTLEKMAENTRNKQFSGVNDIEFKRLNGIAERLESHAGTLEKRLETVGGKEVQSLIKDANKGWRTWKDLSKRNPVGKAAMKGEIPMRTMIDIAKEHPGNDFLHALVESDPELKKHVLAAYAGETNLNKLLKPTSLTKKYIEALPEFEEHVNALKQALTGVKEGEVKAARVKKEYDDLVKSTKDAAKEQKIRQDAIQESDKIKKQIKFKQDAIPKIESKMKKVETHTAEYKKLQKELDEHKKFIQDKGGRLKELGKFFIKVKVAGKVHL